MPDAVDGAAADRPGRARRLRDGRRLERDRGPAADGHDLGRRRSGWSGRRRGGGRRGSRAWRGPASHRWPAAPGAGPSARTPARGSARRATSAAAIARRRASGPQENLRPRGPRGPRRAPVPAPRPAAERSRARGRAGRRRLSRPSAAVMPGQRGITIRSMPSSSATCGACIGPAPPRATSAKRRGSWPRATEMTRSAAAMFALRTRTTAAAASSTDNPSGRCDRRSIAAWAGAASSGARPPRDRAGSSVPSTTWASVTVASTPPMPYAAGPGSAPADSGPTVSDPNRSTRAIDPPPAPIEPTSTCGSATGWPATSPR